MPSYSEFDTSATRIVLVVPPLNRCPRFRLAILWFRHCADEKPQLFPATLGQCYYRCCKLCLVIGTWNIQCKCSSPPPFFIMSRAADLFGNSMNSWSFCYIDIVHICSCVSSNAETSVNIAVCRINLIKLKLNWQLDSYLNYIMHAFSSSWLFLELLNLKHHCLCLFACLSLNKYHKLI